MRRICPGCRTIYDENVGTCPRDGLPLLELSRTSAGLEPAADADALELISELDLNEDSTVAVKPGMMVGEYRIERTIAVGGMGAIYAGVHPVISKRVAIKVINKRYAADPKAVARFVLEARSVNQIGHHNIVDIFSIGELDDGRNYMVMELIDGLPLSHILRRAQRLAPGQILPLYEQLCDALEAAHRKGFIHRDLKPDNLLVLRRPPRPFIKILDFGLAKLRGSVDSQNTEVGTVLGTPEYMAPEQCRGAPVDARTDVYGLGVVAYELLTGVKPFIDPSPLRILSMHQHKPPVPPSKLAPISQRLEQVVLRAIAKKPEDRYPSARELLVDLRRAIPEIAQWPEELVVWQAVAANSSPARGDAMRKDLMAAMAPVSISGEVPPLSGEIEDEDNQQTLVSEPNQHAKHVTKPPSAEVTNAVATAPPKEISEEMPLPVPLPAQVAAPLPHPKAQSSPLDVPQPQPALSGSSASEATDSADSTEVDDQAPAVLVDRPVREARDTPSGPVAAGESGGGNGTTHETDVDVELPKFDPPPQVPSLRRSVAGSARKVPERGVSLTPLLFVALIAALAAVATVLLVRLLR